MARGMTPMTLTRGQRRRLIAEARQFQITQNYPETEVADFVMEKIIARVDEYKVRELWESDDPEVAILVSDYAYGLTAWVMGGRW